MKKSKSTVFRWGLLDSKYISKNKTKGIKPINSYWIFVWIQYLSFGSEKLRMSPRRRILPYTIQVKSHKWTSEIVILMILTLNYDKYKWTHAYSPVIAQIHAIRIQNGYYFEDNMFSEYFGYWMRADQKFE